MLKVAASRFTARRVATAAVGQFHLWRPPLHKKYALLTGPFQNAATQLKLQSLEGWYQINKKDLERQAPDLWFEIKIRYAGSLFKALQTAFPEHKWHPWRFVDEKVPAGYWTDKSARKEFFHWLGKQLGFKDMEPWYSMTKSVIRRHGGSGLLMHYYQDNVRNFIADLCPEHEWIPWKFKRSSSVWTQNQQAHREWLMDAAKRMKFNSLADWYNITTPQLRQLMGDDPVTGIYSQSLPRALRTCFPEHEWQDWRFRASRRVSLDAQRKLLEHTAKTLWGWENPGAELDKWYTARFADLIPTGVTGLLTAKYSSSLSAALKTLYPDHDWEEWRFEKLPNNNESLQPWKVTGTDSKSQ